MAIPVGDVRTASMKARLKRMAGCYPTDRCELCLKPLTAAKRVMVSIDHEQYAFVTVHEAYERGENVSLFPVGTDCLRRIQRAFNEGSK